ncbi:MAG TPA: carbonic anhydrase family protein [Terriglobales bacterium]|nr:carbonic anhydrase family protein [Terriglobales bacterium]
MSRAVACNSEEQAEPPQSSSACSTRETGRKPMIRLQRIALLIFVAVALGIFPYVAAQEQATTHPHWSYAGPGGPADWGDLEPGFALCKQGNRQSPIDIRQTRRADLQRIRFEYKPVPLRIINNGHSIQINVQSGGGITVGAEKYSLVQFHFHNPSEEMIDGRRFDFVAHLVHQDAAGHLAVVAVLMKTGGENPFIQTLWNNLPPHNGTEYAPEGVTVDPAALLPNDQNYYTFTGSLTTPPCTEGVTWYVLKSPVEISGPQIAMFARFYPDNARPVQPANGREILESSF